MDYNEVMFTEGLLAALSQKHITKFPIGEETFKRGLNSVARLVNAEENDDLTYKYDLARLFSCVPLSGVYSRFLQMLTYLNGQNLSLANPNCIMLTINMSPAISLDILNEVEEMDPALRILAEQAAEKFIDGAGLTPVDLAQLN